MAEDVATQLSQRVERDVRQTIGDLTMQTIVLRAMMELQQQTQSAPQPQPEAKTNGARAPRSEAVT